MAKINAILRNAHYVHTINNVMIVVETINIAFHFYEAQFFCKLIPNTDYIFYFSLC